MSISGQSPLPEASKGWGLDKQFVPDTQARLWDISGGGQQLGTYIPRSSEACL